VEFEQEILVSEPAAVTVPSTNGETVPQHYFSFAFFLFLMTTHLFFSLPLFTLIYRLQRLLFQQMHSLQLYRL
jgi:hypothetical protein